MRFKQVQRARKKYIPLTNRAYILSADISPKMLKLGRVTNVKVLFLVLVFVFNFDLFSKNSAAILEKGLLETTAVKHIATHCYTSTHSKQ